MSLIKKVRLVIFGDINTMGAILSPQMESQYPARIVVYELRVFLSISPVFRVLFISSGNVLYKSQSELSGPETAKA